MDAILLQGVVNGLSLGLCYALVAIGFTLIFGVLSAVNFAHGEVYMLGAFAGLVIIQAFAPPFVAVVLLVGAAGALMGFGLERIAFRPLRRARDEASLKSRALREATLMSSLAVGIVVRELAELKFGGDMQQIPSGAMLNDPIVFGSLVLARGDFYIFAAAAVMLLVLQIILYRTRIGLAIRALSDDLIGALYVGIDTDRVIVSTFMIGSAFGAIAGLMVGLYYGAIFPYMGFAPTLKAFIAMLMGGLNNIPGAVICALIIGLSESLAPEIMPTRWIDLIAYVFLLVTLVFFPGGIFGSRAERV
jgi:branched-chain amino acid transport system permease protein